MPLGASDWGERRETKGKRTQWLASILFFKTIGVTPLRHHHHICWDCSQKSQDLLVYQTLHLRYWENLSIRRLVWELNKITYKNGLECEKVISDWWLCLRRRKLKFRRVWDREKSEKNRVKLGNWYIIVTDGTLCGEWKEEKGSLVMIGWVQISKHWHWYISFPHIVYLFHLTAHTLVLVGM